MLHKLIHFLSIVIPPEIRPTIATVSISLLDVETVSKIVSFGLSSAFLVWKWKQAINNKNKKDDE